MLFLIGWSNQWLLSMVRRRSTVRFRNGALVDVLIRKDSNRSRMPVGTNGCPQRHWQPASASPARPCQQLRGMPGAAPPDPGMAGEGAGDGSAGIMPLPAAREGETGRSSDAGPCIASGPDPVAGINRDTVRAPAADAGRRQARAARHLAFVAGRRLTPTPRTAHGKPADRAGKTGRSLAPPPAQSPPGAHSCTLSGPDIPVLCGRRSRGAALRGTDRP